MRRAGLAAAVLVASTVAPAGEGEPARTAGAPAAGIWTPAARERMVRDALKVAPPALHRILARHPEALMDGVRRGSEFEGQPHHRQDAGTPAPGAAASLAAVGRRAVDALNGHRPMRELAFYLGLAAHFAADLSDPVLTDAGGRTSEFAPDYALYVQRNMSRFPVVFYGYPEIDGERALSDPPQVESLEAEGRAAAAGARRYFSHLDRAYLRSGGSSAAFDVRSIPFGVASLCYSRAVTNIARAWLHIWRAARGDLAGTPHLEAPGPREAASSGGGSRTGPPGQAPPGAGPRP